MKKAFKKSIASEIPTFVYFSASWCTTCKLIAPTIQQLKEELGDGIQFMEIDVDETPSLAKKHKVRSMPTLMIFKDKALLWRHSGIIQKADLRTVIQNHI